MRVAPAMAVREYLTDFVRYEMLSLDIALGIRA